jgi:hypothetical protein
MSVGLGSVRLESELKAWQESVQVTTARRPAGIQVAKVLAGEKHAPLVYFALMGTQQVKVGTSTNLRNRMKGFYRSLEDVVLAVPGDEREEAAFHEKFASCRVDLSGRPELFWIRGPVLAFLNQNAPGWRSKGRTSELSIGDCENRIRQIVYHGAPATKLAETARYLAWQDLDHARLWAEGAAAHRDGAMNGGWWYETAFNISTFESKRYIRRLWRRDEREQLAEQRGYRRRWAAVYSAMTAAIAEAE